MSKSTPRFKDPLDVIGGLRVHFRARIGNISDKVLTAMRREFLAVLRGWVREMGASGLASRALTLPFPVGPIGLEAALTKARSLVNAARQEIGDFGLWLLMVHELNPALLSLEKKYGFRIMAMVIHDSLDRMGKDEAFFMCGIMLKGREKMVQAELSNLLRAKQSEMGRVGANALHDQPGGSRYKQTRIREIWATGKYDSRDLCAEQECGALGMAPSTARKALRNTPDPPSRPPAKS